MKFLLVLVFGFSLASFSANGDFSDCGKNQDCEPKHQLCCPTSDHVLKCMDPVDCMHGGPSIQSQNIFHISISADECIPTYYACDAFTVCCGTGGCVDLGDGLGMVCR